MSEGLFWYVRVHVVVLNNSKIFPTRICVRMHQCDGQTVDLLVFDSPQTVYQLILVQWRLHDHLFAGHTVFDVLFVALQIQLTVVSAQHHSLVDLDHLLVDHFWRLDFEIKNVWSSLIACLAFWM